MELKERLVFVLGLIISLFGFLMTSMCIIVVTATDYRSPDENTLGSDLSMGFFLGVVPLIVGIFLCRRMIQKKNRRLEGILENEILKLVAKLKGKITTTELAANTKLSIIEAERKLENYVKMGIAERHISEGGIFVYRFMNVISDKEKYQSKSLNET